MKYGEKRNGESGFSPLAPLSGFGCGRGLPEVLAVDDDHLDLVEVEIVEQP